MTTKLPGKNAPRDVRSSMETKIISVDEVNAWRVPPFQRPLRVNAKVEAIACEIRADGVSISGVLTLGHLLKDNNLYIVDGQHRIEAFRLSGVKEAIADVRIVEFHTISDMADEFVRLNTAIVRMRPDDLLRGLAPGLPPIQYIMKSCPFVGYDNVRRSSQSSAVVSLSVVLRCWYASTSETPSSGGIAITQVANNLDMPSAEQLVTFLNLVHDAWGRDPEFYRMWGALNVAVCAWLYRRVVLDTERRGNYRVSILSAHHFKLGMMALSADRNYVDWLQGRLLNDRDRSPCLKRIKQIVMRRLTEEGIKRLQLPQPAWSHNA